MRPPEQTRCPANRYSVTDGILEARGFKNAGQRLGNRPLAGLIENIPRADLINAAAQVITKVIRHICPNLVRIRPRPGHIHG